MADLGYLCLLCCKTIRKEAGKDKDDWTVRFRSNSPTTEEEEEGACLSKNKRWRRTNRGPKYYVLRWDCTILLGILTKKKKKKEKKKERLSCQLQVRMKKYEVRERKERQKKAKQNGRGR